MSAVDDSMRPWDALFAALDRAGIEHRDLLGMGQPEGARIILDRLRAAGFDGQIDDGTGIHDAVERIDAWNARR